MIALGQNRVDDVREDVILISYELAIHLYSRLSLLVIKSFKSICRLVATSADYPI